MSSGEEAKSPATFEERNPFDVSRRSHTEVAGEIAKRMAAWKQARARSYAVPATPPAGAEKRPQVSAPVQPAHAPKQAERPAAQPVSESQPRTADSAPQQRAAAGNGSGRARVPYFATFSLQRAMPPAPSPKKPDAPSQNLTDSTQSSEAAAMPTASDHKIASAAEAPRVEAPVGETVTEIGALPDDAAADAEAQRLYVETIMSPAAETPAADSGAAMIDPAAAEESGEAAPVHVLAETLSETHSGPEEVYPDPAHEIDDARAQAPAVTATEPAAPAEAADDIEDRRAMARSMRARWIAAHDLDSPNLEESSPLERVAPTTSGPEARAGDAVTSEDTTPKAPEIPFAALPTDVSDDASGRKEPTVEVPMERTVSTERAGAEPAARPLDQASTPDTSQIAAARSIEALDETSGRKEPTFDAPLAQSDRVAEPPPARPSDEAPTTDTPKIVALPIEALDELPGRKERSFGAPMARSDSTGSSGAVPAAVRLSDEAPKAAIPVEALDALSGRKEPTFDKPAAIERKPKEAAMPAAAGLLKGESGIKLRAIETRIEARRIEALRTDPQAPVGRPVIPHLERDEWDVPSPISVNRRAERHGWAIGLGAALLIAGITAPAAIWQHDRQASSTTQDEVALDPALLPPQQKDAQQEDAQQKAGGSTPAPAPKTASATPAAPATVPTPEPAAPQAPVTPAPQLTDAQADTPPAPVAKPEAGLAPQAQPPEQATLSAVQDGGQLDKVPVSAPRLTPKPQAKPQAAPVHLASRAPAPFSTASGQPSGSEMVAKPFVPGPESDHFLRAPTTGAATVPIDDGAGAHGASVVVKPTLMAQLKPKPAGAKPVKGAPQIGAPKPVPLDQSLDQMFQTLVDTLSEGKPANPATKPLPPSNRK